MPTNFVEKYWQKNISPELMRFIDQPADLRWLNKSSSTYHSDIALLVYKEGVDFKVTFDQLRPPNFPFLSVVNWFGITSATVYMAHEGYPNQNPNAYKNNILFEHTIQTVQRYVPQDSTRKYLHESPIALLDFATVRFVELVQQLSEFPNIETELINQGSNRFRKYYRGD
jgi:hypothetical protein